MFIPQKDFTSGILKSMIEEEGNKKLVEFYTGFIKTLPKQLTWGARVGQCFMIYLQEKEPKLYEEIAGSNIDCFYNNNAIHLTIDHVNKFYTGGGVELNYECANAHTDEDVVFDKENEKKKPRIGSIVKFDKESVTSSIYDEYYKETFEGKQFIFLCEVVNAPSHCILGDLSGGKIIGMYHTDNFVEVDEDEV